jgi:membrane fusion protein (multidrug efflux system)
MVRAALALMLSVLAAACSEPAGGTATATATRPPVVVQTITVAAEPMAQTLESVGALTSPNSTEITAEVAGKIVAIDIPEGREVEAGHLLVKIDDAQARAALAVNRARARNAREILARLQALRGAEITSEQELDNARAALEASAGELDTAATLLEKTEIRAPFRGVLGLRTVSLGTYLEPADPIVHLTQTQPLNLVFGLPERHVNEVAVGQAVRALVATCQVFEARVTAIDPRIDSLSRIVQIKAEVPNEDGTLLPGMSVVVQLTIGELDDVLTIPQEAVIREGTQRFVYVVGADDTVETRDVRLGEMHTDRVQVVQGLRAGEVVVATGHQKLRPGATIDAQPYTVVTNPNLALGADGVVFGCDL